MGLRHRHLVVAVAVVFVAAVTLCHLVAVAGLHCRRCSSPPLLLPLATVVVAVAPLALGQVSSSPRFYYSPLSAFAL
ncbi:hypothetical protein BHE74_00015889, partial [Ensete ventricosum]